MLSVYCPSCGAKTEYTVKKPCFCASCGNSFSSVSIAKTNPIIPAFSPPVIPTQHQPINVDDASDEEIKALVKNNAPTRIEISFERTEDRRVKLVDVLGSSAGEPQLGKRSKGKLTKKAKQEMFKTWQTEASEVRKSSVGDSQS